MLNETSNMPDYQWKLTIVERNLLLANWVKLMPEAQAQMLCEADGLMEDLPLSIGQQLLTPLETLQHFVEGELQQKLEQILDRHFRLDLSQAFNFKLNPTHLVESLEVNSSPLIAAVN